MDLFASAELKFERASAGRSCAVMEEPALYEIRPAKKRLE